MTSSGRFNLKVVFPLIDNHYKDKTVVRQSYIHNWNPYAGRSAFYNLDGALVIER